MMRSFMFFFTVLACTLFAEEITVRLSTQKRLQPIYVTALHAKNAPFDKNYLNALEKVLHFDFSHNGRTCLVDNDPKMESILADKNYQQAFYPKIWQEFKVPHVIFARIENKQLLTSVYVASSQVLKHFKALDLTGRLCEDRCLVHKLSDSIFLELFKEKGIASSQILYAFQPSLTSKTSEIWECDYDGANAHPLTAEKTFSLSPTLLNRSSFLYTCHKNGQAKIYLAHTKEQRGKPFISLTGNQFHPKVNAQGSFIAFTSDHIASRNDLYIQALENGHIKGKPIQLYAFPKSVTASPCFSPDGQKMAFVSDQGGNPKIYLIDFPPNGRPQKRPAATLLTSKHNACVCPIFSPDGKKIAYSAKVDGTRQIWIYDTASKTTNQLTFGPGNKENPVFASNSCHIIYNTTDGDTYDLFLVHLNDPKPIKITTGPGLKHYPTWNN